MTLSGSIAVSPVESEDDPGRAFALSSHLASYTWSKPGIFCSRRRWIASQAAPCTLVWGTAGPGRTWEQHFILCFRDSAQRRVTYKEQDGNTKDGLVTNQTEKDAAVESLT